MNFQKILAKARGRLPSKLNPWALPAVTDATQRQIDLVREILGVDLFSTECDEAKVLPLKGPRVARAVGVHRRSVSLWEAFESQTPWLVVLNRALPVKTASFEEALRSARQALWNGGIRSFNSTQDLFQAWVLPQNGRGPRPLVARELILSAPLEMALPKVGGEKTALLYGEVVSRERYGQFVWATLQRLAEVPVGSFPPMAHPLLAGAPSQVSFEKDYYQLGDSRFHRIWSIVPKVNRLVELQKLDVDLLVYVFIDRGTPFSSMWVRASAESLNDLREIEIGLQSFGQTEVVGFHHDRGWDLETIFHAFVPGGITPPPQNHFKVPGPSFLKELTEGVGAVSPRSGDWCLGKSVESGAPIFLNRASAPAVLFIAPPGKGKTTAVSVHSVLTGTPNTLFILLSATEGERMEKWVADFYGQEIALDLPDAEDFEAEEKLFKTDAERVKAFWRKLRGQWQKVGRPVGLPIYLHPKRKSLRFARYAALFAEEFRASMKLSTGVGASHPNFIIVWDDLIVSLELARDLNLLSGDGNRDLREEVIALLRGEVSAEVYLIRKATLSSAKERLTSWVQTFLIFHSREQVELFHRGLLGATNLAVFLSREKVRLFEPEKMIAEPQDDEGAERGLLAELDFGIPLPVVSFFGKPSLIEED